MHHPKLDDLVRRDSRYAYEAYEFVFTALTHTQALMGHRPPPRELLSLGPTEPTRRGGGGGGGGEEEMHVTGKQLLWGIRDLAVREFGLMAPVVFRLWG